jgi:hypothetical protein
MSAVDFRETSSLVEVGAIDGTQEVRHKRHVVQASPNSALQRAGTHKVHGRGRPTVVHKRAQRARVLQRPRPAAELGS